MSFCLKSSDFERYIIPVYYGSYFHKFDFNPPKNILFFFFVELILNYSIAYTEPSCGIGNNKRCTNFK